ncbi:MAG: hydroxymethylpyrimidine/phosphomethylpyrimidine kinase [Ectothiorhodospiraceae bacterium]|nr:hydroxymethylpyrimidine/phosphomethylpyrimidine kinase [Chromatiales bacterium]MCP5153483.1 hydroxymethylpyrimidine/phosphomethylpyrimidine kinase [Ectothiorhodospiraceae bacterium]
MPNRPPEPLPPTSRAGLGLVPTVLVVGGLDPTGGAGLQADIESIASMGAHALPVITAVTAQDTHDVRMVAPLPATRVVEQARAVLADIPAAAIKVGLLGSAEIAQALQTIIKEHPGIPVVVDPICRAGGGTPLADEELLDAMVSLLFPLTTVLTPNTNEARTLAPEADSTAAAAQQLQSYGCASILVTGTHDQTTDAVVNRLYSEHRLMAQWEWERLPGEHHGSGCTLASALAAMLAHGVDLVSACADAQAYTWRSLASGRALGAGQLIPNRLHWTNRGHQR